LRHRFFLSLESWSCDFLFLILGNCLGLLWEKRKRKRKKRVLIVIFLLLVFSSSSSVRYFFLSRHGRSLSLVPLYVFSAGTSRNCCLLSVVCCLYLQYFRYHGLWECNRMGGIMYIWLKRLDITTTTYKIEKYQNTNLPIYQRCCFVL